MEETKTYELGLLLTPLLTEEGVTGLLGGALKAMFERHQLAITETSAPKMIPLAYTIRKRIDNKNQIFREAHFVSLRFSALPENIPAFREELRKASEVVRFLLITIPKVTEAVVERRLPAAPVVVGEKIVPKAEVEVVVDNKKAIDQGIDDLLI